MSKHYTTEVTAVQNIAKIIGGNDWQVRKILYSHFMETLFLGRMCKIDVEDSGGHLFLKTKTVEAYIAAVKIVGETQDTAQCLVWATTSEMRVYGPLDIREVTLI